MILDYRGRGDILIMKLLSNPSRLNFRQYYCELSLTTAETRILKKRNTLMPANLLFSKKKETKHSGSILLAEWHFFILCAVIIADMSGVFPFKLVSHGKLGLGEPDSPPMRAQTTSHYHYCYSAYDKRNRGNMHLQECQLWQIIWLAGLICILFANLIDRAHCIVIELKYQSASASRFLCDSCSLDDLLFIAAL